MYKVTGGGASYPELSAREAACQARSLRRTGLNDVEIFSPAGDRISLYALDQLVRAEGETRL